MDGMRRRKNTQSMQDLNTDTPRSNHVVFVHGTFAGGTRGPGGYAHGSGDMAQVLKRVHSATTFSAVDWSGGATEQARQDAGSYLAKGLLKKFDGDENVHLVGHSHGGNVIGHALQELGASGRTVSSVTMLGTPHWEGVNPSWNAQAMSQVEGTVTTLYSNQDNVQTKGATLANIADLASPISGSAARKLDPNVLSPMQPHKVVNRDVTVFGKGVDHHSSLHDADVLENIYALQPKRYQPPP